MSPSTAPDSDCASIFSYASSSSSATSISDAAFAHHKEIPRGPKRPHTPRIVSSISTIFVKIPGNTQVILPRTLLKPKLKQITREAIAAVNPELASVPLSYIIQSLRALGPNMMAVLARTTAPAPISLPRELTVSVKQENTTNSSSTLFDPSPTHILAVYARANGSIAANKATPRRKVTLFPTHAIVLAAHCAHLPALRFDVKHDSEMPERTPRETSPVSEHDTAREPQDIPPPPTPQSDVNDSLRTEPSKLPQIFPSPEKTENYDITLPVVPLCIPSPSMFPVLQAYLYTKRADHLLGALVPNPVSMRHDRQSTPTLSSTADVTPSATSPTYGPHPQTHGPIASAAELMSQLAETQPIHTLMRAALRTHELWANVAALGVFDERLWLTISFAWHVLLGALEQSDQCTSDSDSSTHSKEEVRSEPCPGSALPQVENNPERQSVKSLNESSKVHADN